MSAQSVKGPLLAGALLVALASCPLVEQQAATLRSLPAGAVTALTPVKQLPQLQDVPGTGLGGQVAGRVTASAAPAGVKAKAKARKVAGAAAEPKGTNARAITLASADKLQASTAAEAALSFALDQLGKPYVWGAQGPDSYDCSGLTMSAYEAAGYQLPRTAAEQALVGTPVDVADLLPGDLLFYATDPSDLSTVHHVVMYAGSGLVVQAPHTGDVVRLDPMWLGDEYAGAVRIVDAAPAASLLSPSSVLLAERSAAASRHTVPIVRPSTVSTPAKVPLVPGSPSATPTAAPTSSPVTASATPVAPPAVPPSVVPDSPAPTPSAVPPSVVPDPPVATPSEVQPSVVVEPSSSTTPTTPITSAAPVVVPGF